MAVGSGCSFSCGSAVVCTEDQHYCGNLPPPNIMDPIRSFLADLLRPDVSVLGAAALLIAFVGSQRGVERLRVGTPLYNLLNLIGALILLHVAVVDRRTGFIILEAVWAAVTIPPLLRSARGALSR